MIPHLKKSTILKLNTVEDAKKIINETKKEEWEEMSANCVEWYMKKALHSDNCWETMIEILTAVRYLKQLFYINYILTKWDNKKVAGKNPLVVDCDYIMRKNSSWTKHLNTKKHKKNINKSADKVALSMFVMIVARNYKSYVGLMEA